MNKSKKNLKQQRHFTDLSPQVIVFEILTYWKHSLCGMKNSGYFPNSEGFGYFPCKYKIRHSISDLFGTFNLDPRRNIWFIFRTLRFQFEVPHNVYVNWKKVEFCDVYMDKLFLKNIEQFSNLKTLKLHYSEDVKEVSLKRDQFPKLKRLFLVLHYHDQYASLCKFISRTKNELFTQKYFWNGRKENRHIQVELHFVVGQMKDSFFEKNPLENVTILWFSTIRGVWGLKWNQFLKNIKHIVFQCCPHIVDDLFQLHNFEKLKTLKLLGCDYLSGHDWDKSIEGIEVLEIEVCREVQYCLFHEHEFKNLRRLKIQKCRWISEYMIEHLSKFKEHPKFGIVGHFPGHMTEVRDEMIKRAKKMKPQIFNVTIIGFSHAHLRSDASNIITRIFKKNHMIANVTCLPDSTNDYLHFQMEDFRRLSLNHPHFVVFKSYFLQYKNDFEILVDFILPQARDVEVIFLKII